MQLLKPSRLPALAVSECLLILPAAVLLAAAALRSLQPVQYEPARTSSLILEWIVPRLSHLGSAFLFIALPGLVAVLGCAAIGDVWKHDPGLRDDFLSAVGILRRHLTIVGLLAVTVLAGSILAFAATHLITD